MNITCLLVDDEPNAVELLDMLISQHTDWQVIGKCYDALEALSFLKTQRPDLLFLDINMPRLSGMELAGLLPPQTRIVFTTAYSEFAAESYSYQTLDYLLKPITLKRFLAARQKIEAGLRQILPVTNTDQSPSADYFFVKSGKSFRKLDLTEVQYFEVEKEYVKLVTAGEEIWIYRRLKEIEAQLSLPFARIHNSFIVNTKAIQKIQDNHVYIAGRQIPVSEKFRVGFMELIAKRLF